MSACWDFLSLINSGHFLNFKVIVSCLPWLLGWKGHFTPHGWGVYRKSDCLKTPDVAISEGRRLSDISRGSQLHRPLQLTQLQVISYEDAYSIRIFVINLLSFYLSVHVKAYLCVYLCILRHIQQIKYACNHRQCTVVILCLVVCSWNQEISGMKVEGARGKLYLATFSKFKVILEAVEKTNHQPCIILHWVVEGTDEIAHKWGTGSSSMS